VPAWEEVRICALRRRTGWSPRRIAVEVARPHSTVHQVLRRGGCSRREPTARPPIVRYEWPCPGQLLHIDTKRLGKFTEAGHAFTGDRARRSRHAGWESVHSIVDDCSRLASSEIHDDELATTVTAFTHRALDWFLENGIVAERLMSDNAFAYVRNKSLKALLHARAIDHLRIRPYTPRTNGKVERYQQTLQREWAYAMEYASSDARRASLPPLQRAAHPQRPQQPTTPLTRSGRHRAAQNPLKLVHKQPGITIAEMAKRMRIQRTISKASSRTL
jgi:hypothetical protein